MPADEQVNILEAAERWVREVGGDLSAEVVAQTLGERLGNKGETGYLVRLDQELHRGVIALPPALLELLEQRAAEPWDALEPDIEEIVDRAFDSDDDLTPALAAAAHLWRELHELANGRSAEIDFSDEPNLHDDEPAETLAGRAQEPQDGPDAPETDEEPPEPTSSEEDLPAPPPRHPEDGREPELVYRYRDEAGALAYIVARYRDPKDFRPCTFERGCWRPGYPPRRLPYRLPELRAALEADPDARVYITEGEKDADEIRAAGGVATCSPGGSNGWHPDDREGLAETLQAAGVWKAAIVAHRDAAGETYARSVRAALGTRGIADVELVQAVEGKDAADHLASGRTLDELVPLELERGQAAPDGELDVRPFEGRSHADVLALELPAERYLVEGLVPIGAVGTIAGVPETHKSWLAQAIAVRVARGEGEILGRPIVRVGRVGYFWQDDSTREEAERVKLFERAHATPDPAALPLRWFLNEGLELPAGLPRLRATVESLALDLAILDSFYNVLPGIDLKDADPERIVALLKREISDPTGCTVLIVDHMPWATDTNRGRLRAYGGVFKSAATRFGIYIDAQGSKLYLEARGNNIRGVKKTPAYWDEENLELHLVETGDQTHDDRVEQRAEKALAWLRDNPGRHSTTAVRKAIGGRAEVTDEALEALKTRDEVQDLARDGGTWSGRRGDVRYWIASIHAASEGTGTTSRLPGTWSDEVPPRSSEDNPRPTPYRGDEVGRDEVPANVDHAEIERLTALADDLHEGQAT